MVNLAGVLNDLGLHGEAATYLERARDIQIGVFGPDHPRLACTLTSLGRTARLRGDDAQARKDFDRATEIVLQQPSDRALGTALNTRACQLISNGGAEMAVHDLRQALAIVARTRPPDHPDRITAYLNLAQALDAAGEPYEAVEQTSRALDLEEKALGTRVGLGSLREAGLFLEQLRRSTAWAVGLHVRSAPDHPEAVRLALTTVLRRKGRELETSARNYGALDDPEADELRAALRRTREAWAFLDLRPFDPLLARGQAREWCLLTDRVDLLSRELRKVHHRFGQPPPTVTVEAVQERLPRRAALVELFLFQPLTDPKTKEQEAAPRYLAYVLHRQGEPTWADLGDADAIDLLVAAFRESLAQRRADVETHARRLDRRTMAQVRPLLGEDVDTLLLSPDGSLNLVPFAALVDEKGAYLLERYNVSYLSSGRDLLREAEVPSREPPLVVGAPAHEAGPESSGRT